MGRFCLEVLSFYQLSESLKFSIGTPAPYQMLHPVRVMVRDKSTSKAPFDLKQRLRGRASVLISALLGATATGAILTSCRSEPQTDREFLRANRDFRALLLRDDQKPEDFFDPKELKALEWSSKDADTFYRTILGPRLSIFSFKRTSFDTSARSQRETSEIEATLPSGRSHRFRYSMISTGGKRHGLLRNMIEVLWELEYIEHRGGDLKVPEFFWAGVRKDAERFDQAGLKGLVSPDDWKLQSWAGLMVKERRYYEAGAERQNKMNP